MRMIASGRGRWATVSGLAKVVRGAHYSALRDVSPLQSYGGGQPAALWHDMGPRFHRELLGVRAAGCVDRLWPPE
jgi:hypothetical protein